MKIKSSVVHNEGRRVCTEVERTPLLQLRCSSTTEYYTPPHFPTTRYTQINALCRGYDSPWSSVFSKHLVRNVYKIVWFSLCILL